jgi:hypothetical protein
MLASMEQAFGPCSLVVPTIPGTLSQTDMVRASGAFQRVPTLESTIREDLGGWRRG